MRPWLILALVLTAGAARAAPFDALHAAGVDGRPGAQAPMDLPLVDETGRAVTLRSLSHGQPLVLVPVQHRCPNICGATLGGVVQAVHGQGGFQLVAFGIDPREGPADAAASIRQLRGALPAAQNLHAVTGSAQTVAAVTQALGYRYAWDPRLGQYDHVAAVAVLTADGRLSTWLYGVAPPPELMRAALANADKGGLAALGDRLLLLCYHYDPATGRYGPLAFDLLRAAAALVAVALAAFIALSLWAERRRRAVAP